MDDWLSLSDLPDPNNREEVDVWLLEREQQLADKIAKALDEVVTNAYASFLSTLTASGDLSRLDSIIGEWTFIASRDILPDIEETYLSGAISAYTQAPGTRRIPRNRVESWADVVNTQAVEYMESATNRMSDVGRTVWRDIRDRTTTAISQGKSTEDLKSAIEDLGKFSEYRADTIARTEINAAYINGDWNGATALGEFGPVEKTWVASFGPRTRPSHAAVNGTTIPVQEPFSVGGVPMMYPHSPGAPAGEVVNCRCHVDYYYAGDTRPDGTVIGEPQGQQQTMEIQYPSTYQAAKLSATDFDGQYESIISSGGGVDGDLSPMGDRHLLELWKRQGFDARPRKVTVSQLDDLVEKEGWTKVHRGIAGDTTDEVEKYVKQFVDEAEPYPGKGMFGNGTYASRSVSTADQFTRQTARGDATTFGVRLDMALHPEAKIVDYEDLFPRMRQIVEEERTARNALYDAVKGSDDLSFSDVIARAPEGLVSVYRDAETKRYLLAEKPSNIATVDGYDAIRIVNPHVNQMSDEKVDDIYYIILNSCAVAVRQP
jgi:hypothetical protein